MALGSFWMPGQKPPFVLMVTLPVRPLVTGLPNLSTAWTTTPFQVKGRLGSGVYSLMVSGTPTGLPLTMMVWGLASVKVGWIWKASSVGAPAVMTNALDVAGSNVVLLTAWTPRG